MTPAPWQDVLDFWFLPSDDPNYLKPRHAWFKKDPAFDAQILELFGGRVQRAVDGGLPDWRRDPDGALARIVLLDQFPRNIWRGTPRAFSGDARALTAALELVDSGRYLRLHAVQRAFAYMPLMHSENLDTQERSVALFTTLAQEHPASQAELEYAIRHRDVIARFGRFPHRNAIVGRGSTSQEIDFLKQPGSTF